MQPTENRLRRAQIFSASAAAYTMCVSLGCRQHGRDFCALHRFLPPVTTPPPQVRPIAAGVVTGGIRQSHDLCSRRLRSPSCRLRGFHRRSQASHPRQMSCPNQPRSADKSKTPRQLILSAAQGGHLLQYLSAIPCGAFVRASAATSVVKTYRDLEIAPRRWARAVLLNESLTGLTEYRLEKVHRAG